MSAVCVSVCVPAYLSWSLAGSMAAVKLEGIITRTSLLKDVRQLSPQHQTYSLEAFHSLILHFAPKHTGFSYHGMYSRNSSYSPLKQLLVLGSAVIRGVLLAGSAASVVVVCSDDSSFFSTSWVSALLASLLLSALVKYLQ
ncbi:unnamed protein product [Boreogadus saida]